MHNKNPLPCRTCGAKDSATPVCLSKRPVIKVASVGRVPNAADTVEKRGHRQPHGPAAGSARPSAWPTCHVSHPSMTPRSASVLPDAYTSGLSPVMLRMEPYTYPHFSRRRLRGCRLSIYRQRMESFGHNTFFTLEQAREEAARRHLECRQVLSRIRSRSSLPLYVSHGTALELHGMIATMNYLPGYGSELVHVSVCRQRDLRKIQGMKFHYARHGVDVVHADELVSSVSAMQAVCQIAPLCRRTESGDRHGLAHLRQSRFTRLHSR